MTDKQTLSEITLRLLFGENLKRLRANSELSQLVLAEKADLAHTFINDLENGKKWISCKTIARLCQALNVEPYQFFLPISKPEQEQSEILSVYLNDFSESVIKSVAEFKNRYLNEK
jgi:transcriptional regulator with XRE-family HTH domain